MKRFVPLLIVVCLLISIPAFAEEPKKGLFVNLTSNDTWRAGMAVMFANNMLKKGHPSTILLNVEGVFLADTTVPQHKNGQTGKTVQEMLKGFMKGGGQVLICPPCMQQVNVKKENLITGVALADPSFMPGVVFGNVQIMSW